uniref:gliding motility-associated C-terminal domain-containing protein n=1 Tax=Flavobacterium sp. TaxID=239 RepID=UPI00374DE1B8
PTLNTTSPNGIVGAWSPNTISNTTSGSYIFTPNTGQCATNTTLVVTITAPTIVPNFVTTLNVCNGTPAPTLNTTSPNGIVGTWSPNIISNTTSGSYNFTPNTGQCATNTTLVVTITAPTIVPNFATTLSLCIGETPPVLNTSSPNGISGTWTPSIIDNTASGSYIFTPNTGQCAINTTLNVSFLNTLDFEIIGACIENNYILQVTSISSAFDLNTANYVWENSNNVTVGTNSPYFDVTSYLDSTSLEEQVPISFNVTVTTPQGCYKTEIFTIDNMFCSIPKGISPNGDNNNDFFDLRLLNIRNLSIFNRYGIKVYSKDNYTNQWMGQTDSGTELPDATYYYVIEFDDNQPTKTGWVYINR